MKRLPIVLLLLASVALASIDIYAVTASQSRHKIMTTNDIMKFESLKRPVISATGEVLAVEVAPDRGNSHGLVKSLTTSSQFILAGGSKPKISRDGHFAAFVVEIPLLKKEMASDQENKKSKAGMVLLDTKTGKESRFERVKEFRFNDSGTHLAVWFEPQENESSDDKGHFAVGADKKDKSLNVDKFDEGSEFRLIALNTDASQKIANVTRFYFDKVGKNLVLSSNNINAKKHQLVLVSLNNNEKEIVRQFNNQQIGEVSLSEDGKYIAFTHGDIHHASYGREYHLSLLDIVTRDITFISKSKDWKLNRYTKLKFSKDSERLFFGRVPQVSQQAELKKITKQDDLFDPQIVTEQRGLRIWHGEDPRIKPNEIKKI